MLDPATIGLAIAGVRTTAELVKKGIAAAKDVNEVTQDLGKLFDHTDTLSKAKKEVKSGKNKSLSQQAMDIVVAEENAKKQIEDIKQKLYWGPYPNGANIYKKFLATRSQMIREQKLEREREIARKKQRIDNIIYYGTVIAILGFGGFMVWFIVDMAIGMGQRAGKW
jgi:YesN/AraC family two-component response regulator